MSLDKATLIRERVRLEAELAAVKAQIKALTLEERVGRAQGKAERRVIWEGYVSAAQQRKQAHQVAAERQRYRDVLSRDETYVCPHCGQLNRHAAPDCPNIAST